MSLTAPWFLLGLAALALPVIFHLARRQDRTVIDFPSLMFLRDIPHKETRKRTLRDRFLLLLRCLALAALAIAFTQPALVNVAGLQGATGQDLLIVLDRSFSMRHADRWALALQRANQALDDLTAGDRSGLLVFDRGVEVISEMTAERATIRDLLATLEPADESSNYHQALAVAAEQLLPRDGTTREVLLISDFQRTGHDPSDAFQLPAGIALRVANIAAPTDVNHLVVGVTERRLPGPQPAYEVEAQVARFGPGSATLVAILEIAGAIVQEREVTVAQGINGVARFRVEAPDVGASAARVRLGSVGSDPVDALPGDDAFYWRFGAPPSYRVGILTGAGSRERQNLYLRQALQLSQAPQFIVADKPLDLNDASSVSDLAMIVINDAPVPGGKTTDQLRSFVAAGGGLLVATGDAVVGQWPAGADGLLPGVLGARVDRSEDRPRGTIASLTIGHPALSALRDPAAMSSARIWRYRNLDLSAAGDDVQTLGIYDDGAPALVERAIGRGRVIVLTSTLDTFWNELALAPLYAPLLQGLSRYLVGYSTSPASYSVGQVVDLVSYARAQPNALQLASQLATGGVAAMDMPDGDSVSVSADRPFSLSQAGIYQLKRDAETVVLAVNVDSRESDLRQLDAEAFARAVSTSADQSSAETQTELAHFDRPLWHWLLIVAFGLLAGELFWSNWRRGTPFTEKIHGTV